MASKQQRSVRTQINLTTANAGQREVSKMVNGTRNHAVVLHAKATVDITTAGTAVRNKGSVWALFDEIGLDENGRDRHFYDGRLLRFGTEVQALSSLSATRLTGFGIQTITIEETAVLWFSPPFQAGNPHETTFREIDARQTLQVFAKLSSTALAKLITGGVGTVTAISIEVTQLHDPRSKAVPIFIPSTRQIVSSVPGASTQFKVEVDSSNWIRALLIQQEDDAGLRADIINKISLIGDFRPIIGPQLQTLESFARNQELEFGGDVFADKSQLVLWFQQGGRLSNILNPSDDVNLRFEFDVSASGTNPKIRIAIMELERITGLTSQNIPFFA